MLKRDSSFQIPLSRLAHDRDPWAVCEQLMASLDEIEDWVERAWRVVRSIDVSLRSAYTQDEVQEFIAEAAPLLQSAGHRVFLPSLAATTPSRVTLDWDVETRPESFFTLDALCSFDWRLTIGGHEMSEEALRSAVTLRRDLVEIAGSFLSFDLDDTARLLRWIGRAPPPGEYVSSDLVAQIGVLSRGVEWGTDANLPTELLNRLFEVARGGGSLLAPVAISDASMLRPYQIDGVDWMLARSAANVGVVLADEMGLGKTRQVLAVIAAERAHGRAGPRSPDDRRGARPSLIVCPAAVLRSWAREAAIVDPSLRVVIHHGPSRQHGSSVANSVDIVVTTYDVMASDIADLASLSWDRLVLDEAQRIKNPGSIRAKSARGLAQSARHRIAVTGTPIENRLSDLHSVLEFANPGLAGSRATFVRAAAEMGSLESGDSSIRQLLGHVMLRRTKEAVAPELPPKVEIAEYCGLTPGQTTMYQAVVEKLLDDAGELAGFGRQSAILSSLTRLKQVCNHPALLVGDSRTNVETSGKVLRFLELAEEIRDAGDRALVFTQFVSMGRILSTFLQDRLDCPTALYHGGLGQADRDTMLDKFRSGDDPFLIMSLQAGGVGITVTEANRVIHFDRWWNPAVEDQATDRTHRIGQRRTVFVHTLICQNTIEDRIDALLHDKRQLAAEFVAPSSELSFSSLTVAELADLVTLR